MVNQNRCNCQHSKIHLVCIELYSSFVSVKVTSYLLNPGDTGAGVGQHYITSLAKT